MRSARSFIPVMPRGRRDRAHDLRIDAATVIADETAATRPECFDLDFDPPSRPNGEGVHESLAADSVDIVSDTRIQLPAVAFHDHTIRGRFSVASSAWMPENPLRARAPRRRTNEGRARRSSSSITRPSDREHGAAPVSGMRRPKHDPRRRGAAGTRDEACSSVSCSSRAVARRSARRSRIDVECFDTRRR